MARPVFFLVSQDGEPVQLNNEMAPKTVEASRAAHQGLWRIGDEMGFPVTNFPHVQVVEELASMWKSTVGDERRTVGLHSHPWKDKLLGYEGPLSSPHWGGLTEDEQIRLLKWARQKILDKTGILVHDFRSGNFSTNKSIHKTLAAAGFTGSSCSAPGHDKKDTFSSWPNAEPYPYWGNEGDPFRKGTLRLVEFPQSMDLSKIANVNGYPRHPDLTPDIAWPDFGFPYKETMNNSLDQQLEAGNPFLYFSSLTHNHVDYSNDQEPQSVRIREIFETAKEVCAERGFKLVPVTLTQAKRYYEEICPYAGAPE
ncbi:hypothetical protein A3G24_17730 [Aspergillus terreus]|uniref:Uncharacterized protein n=1 Tax=Aspergillus terreus TaxID=33178 RepID=A0A5M3YKN4_ASPTE|nr:hypothetical protein ATETN484_0001000500 [Aspergillus terreus]GFF11786.1 hypothetical protein A3G24_17730 [Aspergillus terreus]